MINHYGMLADIQFEYNSANIFQISILDECLSEKR